MDLNDGRFQMNDAAMSDLTTSPPRVLVGKSVRKPFAHLNLFRTRPSGDERVHLEKNPGRERIAQPWSFVDLDRAAQGVATR